MLMLWLADQEIDLLIRGRTVQATAGFQFDFLRRAPYHPIFLH